MRKLVLGLLLFLFALVCYGQNPTAQTINSGATLPTGCTPSNTNVFILISGGVGTPYYCSAANTWTVWTGGGGSGCTSMGAANTVQKADGVGGCAASSITDTSSSTLIGTTNVSAYRMTLQIASLGQDPLAILNQAGSQIATLVNNGTWNASGYAIGSTWLMAGAQMQLANSNSIGWSGTGAYSGTKDVGLGRDALGVVGVTDGILGTNYRDMKMRNLTLTGSCTGCATGTVTSIATTAPITGGTITTTGTIACATCVTSAASLTSTAIMTGAGSQGSQTPNSSATVDSSGNLALPGNAAMGVGSGLPGNTGTSFYTNDGSTGTANNKLVKISAGSTVVTMGTTDTDGAVGICLNNATSTCGTTGNANVVFGGVVGCVFDGATTLGHFVQISATTGGDCHDAGATRPGTGQVIGTVLTTNVGAGTYNVALLLNAPTSTAGNITVGSTTISGGTSTQCLYDNAGVVGTQACGGSGSVQAPIAIGSLPGSHTAGAYYPWFTDSPLAAYDNGSTYDYALPGWGAVTRPQAAANFTTLNFTGASLTDANGGLRFRAPANGGGTNSLRFAYVTATPYPTPPFSRTICFIPTFLGINYWLAGFAISDGTAYTHFPIGVDSNINTEYHLEVSNWTNATTFSAAVGSNPWMPKGQLICETYNDDGTNINIYFSSDPNDLTEAVAFSRTRTTFLTPTRLGIGLNIPQATTTGSILILHSTL